MYALIVCMQVFWVYVFFICIIITSFFRISVFSFNIRLIFLYVISYCLLAWFLSHHRRCCRKTNGGGMRVIRVSRVGLRRWEVKLERLRGRKGGIINQIESFVILSLRVPFLGSLCSNYIFY